MSDEKAVKGGLARNRRSAYIHRLGCSRLRPGHVRWLYADRNPDIDWKTTAPWLKACSVCNPPSPFKPDQHTKEESDA